MSKAKVILVNVSKPYENVFIKELNINVAYGGDFTVTNDFTFDQISSANSLLTAIQNDNILVKINGILQSKTDSIAYVTTPSSGGSGEANTASNVGSGAGVFKQKTGVDLELRSISSSDLNVAQDVDEIEIQAQPQLITNYASVTPVSGMQVLLEDSGTLKRGDVSNFLGSGTIEQFYLERVETIDNATTTDIEYFTTPQNSTEISNVISVTGGDYFFEWSFLCRNTSRSGRVVVDLQTNSTSIFSQDFRREPKDNQDIFYTSISKRINLSAGSNTIQIQLSNDGSGTARIFEANVLITKL